MEEYTTENDFREKSEDYEDIVTKMPSSLIMWGSTFIFFFFILILSISYFVKFPDIIDGNVMITSVPSPQKLISKTSGQLKIVVDEGKIVQKGQVIGVVDDTEDIWRNVILLDSILLDVLSDTSITISNISTLLEDTQNLSLLGELNYDYSLWKKALKNYTINFNNNLLRNKKNNIKSQISKYENLNNNLLNQVSIHSEEIRISSKKYKRDSVLKTENVISSSDFEDAEYAFLQTNRQKISSEAQIISNEITLSKLTNSINEITIQESKEELTLINEILNKSITLRSSIKNWKQKHLMTAQFNGHVAFLDFLINQQFVHHNTNLFSVIPLEYTLQAKIKVPTENFGKISNGQKVNIKLDAYPFEEYGIVKGEISHIYQFSKENRYLCNVKLQDRLTTTYNKKLIYKQDLSGKAQIITKDYNLLDRLFHQFRQIDFD